MKISKTRLKQIIKEELQSMFKEQEEEEEEGLKSQLFKDREGSQGDVRGTALGGRKMIPGEMADLEAEYTPIDDDETSQDAGLYMSRGDFNPASEAGSSAVGMFSPEEMAASKLAKKDYGKDVPAYMRAGYKGDAPAGTSEYVSSGGEEEDRLKRIRARREAWGVRDPETGRPKGGRWVGTKWIPDARAGKKAWRDANRAMKAAAKKIGKPWQKIGPKDGAAWEARVAARKAFKAMKSGKAAGSSRAVAKKLPLPKLRTREPGDVQGLVKRGVEGGGSAAELKAKAGSETGRTALDLGGKPKELETRKLAKRTKGRLPSLADKTASELQAIRSSFAKGELGGDTKALSLYNRVVKSELTKLRKENPGGSDSMLKPTAKMNAKKRMMKVTTRMIAAAAKRERSERMVATPELD